MRAAGEGRILIQAGRRAHAIRLRPEKVAERWQFPTTRVYELDEQGERVRAARHRVQDGALKVGPFLRPTRLEALCGDATRAPDLAIGSTRLANGASAVVEQGAGLPFEVNVRNLGFAPAEGRVEVYADQAEKPMLLASSQVALGPNSSQALRIGVPTERLDGDRTLLFVAKLDGDAADLCPRNNVKTTAIHVKPNWSHWPARVNLVADAGPVERQDAVVVMPIDFSPILGKLGLRGPLDRDALRVAECDAGGKIKALVPSQFDATDRLKGELCWIMPGRTPANTQRRFCVLLRTGKPSLLPVRSSAWRADTATVTARGYVARFSNGVLT